MDCGVCGEPFRAWGGETTTLVSYFSPPGHDHDDNCVVRLYWCKNGHQTALSKRKRCSACNWVGDEACFCHPGQKVEEWPDLPLVAQ